MEHLEILIVDGWFSVVVSLCGVTGGGGDWGRTRAWHSFV